MRLRARRPGQRTRSSRGQALVEFALILPVMLMLTLGVVDGARVFTAYISLKNAVREAAIFAGYPGNYTKWCTPDYLVITVPCPDSFAQPLQGSNRTLAPDNLTTRVFYEANGMDAAAIVLEPPVCDGPNAPICDEDSTLVTVTAHYPVPIVTPMLSQIWGGSLDLKSTTTAQILVWH
jgi:hypothetical protein